MTTVRKSHLFVAAALGMMLYGIVATTLGAILPSIIESFHLTKTVAGTLFTFLSAGIFTGSLLFGPVVDRYGYKRLLVVCTFILGLGLAGIANSQQVFLLQMAVYLVGLGGGAVNGSTNALVADISDSGRGAGLSLLGVFFGVGAFGVPLAIGFFLDSMPYSHLIGILGVLVSIPLFYFGIIRFPEPKRMTGTVIKDVRSIIKEPAILLFGFILFLQSGTEIIVGGWTTSFFAEKYRIGPGYSAFILSLFWFAMVVSRLILGFTLSERKSYQVLASLVGTAFLGAIVVIMNVPLGWGLVGLFLLGFGLAAGFPLILGVVGDRFPALSGTAFSVIFVTAIIGSSVFGPLAGSVADRYNLTAALGIAATNLLLMFLLLFAGRRHFTREPVRTVRLMDKTSQII